jgi:small Trp-rich protein
MWFVLVGVLLLLMKLAELGPVANWSWWIVLLPFGLAIAWWSFADSIGWTQQRAMDKMEKKKADRRLKAMDALGITARRDRKLQRAHAAARKAAADAPPPPPPTKLDPHGPVERNEPKF